MSSLLAAMVQASKAFADPIISEYASGNRPFTVEIRRPEGGMPTFDRDTGVFSNPVDPLVYTGPARIWPAQGGTELEIGDESVPFSAATISVDYFTSANSPDPTAAPETDMTVTVISTPQAVATHLAGRVFEITGVDVGGHFGTGWTLQVLGGAASRHG